MSCVSSYASGEVEKEKLSGKSISKILFSPVSAFAGEKKLHSAVQNGTVQFVFFFLKKRKMNLGVTQKWVMTHTLTKYIY